MTKNVITQIHLRLYYIISILANLYEKKVFDYAKLSGILRKAATLFEKVISSNEDGLRFEPEYFRVGFYGQGFPLFLRVIFHILNKTEIHSDFKTANQSAIIFKNVSNTEPRNFKFS